jgi:hypothetical protein
MCTKKKDVWVPEPVWELWGREEPVSHPSPNLTTITLSWKP